MIEHLRIEVLGSLRLSRSGRVITITSSRKTRALVAYLGVVARPVTRNYLCDLLWEQTADPRAALRWSLHKIRQAFGAANADCLRTNGDQVFLDRANFVLDLDEIKMAGLGGLGTSQLEAVAAKFRGRFLDGLELSRCQGFEAWRIYHERSTHAMRCKLLRLLVKSLPEHSDRAKYHANMLRHLDPDGDDGIDGTKDPHRASVWPSPARQAPRYEGPGVGDMRPRRGLHFCDSRDGVRIAYAVSGAGPPLVRAAHWMSHVRQEGESPVWSHWVEALSEHMTLLRYDQRGNGLSDWDVADFSFERMLEDLECVIEDAGLERFVLLGVSQSCSVAVAYAVRHPEKVSRLILYGGFARGWRKRGDPKTVASHEAMTTLIREGWGQKNPAFRRLFTEMLTPGADEDAARSLDNLQAQTTSPENAAQLHEAFGAVDVSELLQDVSAPTLVLHARDDGMVPFECGRVFATGIPGARFRDLESANHILTRSEPAFATFVQEVLSFAGVNRASFGPAQRG